MKGHSKSIRFSLALTALLTALFLTACGDDDFSPMAKNRGYDYMYASAKDLSKTPCNEMREGRDAVVGRDKDMYTCVFDRADSVYLWIGDSDTLTAEGFEYIREESSSSSDESSSSSSGSSSSYSSSSSSYSSSSYSSSSYRYSSSANPSSSFSVESRDQILNPNISYGIMTDPRDGQKYKTVEINGQTWMAQNLNFADSTEYPLLKGKNRCYRDIEEDCEILGRLYSRSSAMNDSRCSYGSSCSLGDGPIQGICPDGWHIPSYSEANTFVDYIGESNAPSVMSEYGWGGGVHGTNTYGLSLTSPGSWESGSFDSRGGYEHLWVYRGGNSSQYYILVQGLDKRIFVTSYSSNEVYFTVRCLKGEALPVSSSSSSSYSSSSYSSSSYSSSSSSYRQSYYTEDSTNYSVKLPTQKSDLFNPDIDYGTMTDPRDGKVYRTLRHNGITWMAENLNFSDSTDYPVLEGKNRCYNDEEDNCELFGRLYSRSAAFNDESCVFGKICSPSQAQGICPEGWRLPLKVELTNISDDEGGAAHTLMSAYGWLDEYDKILPGEDTYGFSFAGSGFHDAEKGFRALGLYGMIWHYDQGSTAAQDYLVIQGQQDHLFFNDFSSREVFISVRCVKED